MRSFRCFCFFDSLCFIKKNSGFAFALYKGLVEFFPAPPTCETVLACLIALAKLSKKFSNVLC